MSRLGPLFVLLFAVAGAVETRRARDADVIDGASAYRLRLIELTAAAAAAPESDRFLEHPAGRSTPWPALYHGALGTLVRLRTAPTGRVTQRGVIDGPQVERTAAAAAPILAALATLLAFAAASRLSGGSATAGAIAAMLYAFLPFIAGQERAELGPHPLAAALCFGQLALLPGVFHGRELSDSTLASLSAGAAAGLAMLADAGALLFVAALAVGLTARAAARDREGKGRDAWRPALLYVVTAAVITTLPPAEHGPRFAALLPLAAGHSALAGAPAIWLAWIVFPLACLRVAHPPSGVRTPERALLAWTGSVALIAATLDTRFTVVLSACLVAAVAVALGDLASSARRRTVLAAAVVLLAPAFAPLAMFGPAGAASFDGGPLTRGLRWMRDQTPSAGPFNHPAAHQDWCVLTAPSFGGTVAYHARRPVAAASFAGVVRPSDRRVARALLARTPEEFTRALQSLDARYVVVTPRMLDDPLLRGAGTQSALHRLALPPEYAPADHYSGLELVYAASRWDEPGGPAISIYRRTREAPAEPTRPEASVLR